MIPVYFLVGGRVLNGRVVNAGDVHELPASVAEAAVRSGECRHTVKVRALRPHLSIGTLVCAVGDTGYVDRHRALTFHEGGHAEIVEGLSSPEQNDIRLARALAAGDAEAAAQLAWFPPPPAPPAPPRRLPLPNRAEADAAR